MNKQQKVNFVCIITVIFAGLIIMGGERSLRDNVQYKSIAQYEAEEKIAFDSIDRKDGVTIPFALPPEHNWMTTEDFLMSEQIKEEERSDNQAGIVVVCAILFLTGLILVHCRRKTVEIVKEDIAESEELGSDERFEQFWNRDMAEMVKRGER